MNLDELAQYVPHATVTVAVLGTAVGTTLHALFHKQDVRATIGWIALVWLSPLVGAVLYALFGVNRIRRQAKILRENVPRYQAQQPEQVVLRAADVTGHLGEPFRHLTAIARIGDRTIDRPLVGGNDVQPLYDGDEAYPAMLEAIDDAETSISLMTYIFDNDRWGRKFMDALVAAQQRGVEVRVLIDATGNRYSFPSTARVLRRRGIRIGRFLPSSFYPPHVLSANLRNHRKIMVVDGRIGFTGGMNIRAACVLEDRPRMPTRDLHFRVEGPVVAQLQEIFAEDWTFSTKERLEGPTWFPPLEARGTVIARGVPDGPDEDLDKLRWTLLGALTAAQQSICIVTPYFLPDEPLREALIVARMRGVQVDVILPRLNNLPYVAWAAMGELEPLLEADVRVYFTDGPFNHSKLTIVDERWVLVGSPNWDPRSLRLNFEYAVECYDREFGERMTAWAATLRAGAARYTYEAHYRRRFDRRLLHGVAGLASPYL